MVKIHGAVQKLISRSNLPDITSSGRMIILEILSLFFFFRFYGTLKPKGHVIACRITAENPDEVCINNYL